MVSLLWLRSSHSCRLATVFHRDVNAGWSFIPPSTDVERIATTSSKCMSSWIASVRVFCSQMLRSAFSQWSSGRFRHQALVLLSRGRVSHVHFLFVNKFIDRLRSTSRFLSAACVVYLGCFGLFVPACRGVSGWPCCGRESAESLVPWRSPITVAHEGTAASEMT